MGALSKLLKVGIKAAERAAPRAAEKDAAKLAVKKVAKKALPAPEKRLALPAPKPGRLETYKDVSTSQFKPKGGQWMPDAAITGSNNSPEYATRALLSRSNVPPDSPLHPWAVKALPKYVKRDMGTVDDPLSALAERGFVQDADGREGWLKIANSIIGADPAAEYQGVDQFFGKPVADVARARKHNRFFSGVEETMPWVHKLPGTDPVYTLYGDHPFSGTPFSHTLDELQNAMNPASGLPPHLQVGESTLQRMSWPQAVERVGGINDWREAQMAAERANLLQTNPAFHKVMDLADDPNGLAWYQIKLPGDGAMDEGGNIAGYDDLAAALKNEGDSMGHCVGGYCYDVQRGDSEIYSLRDAKGEPHVTIETAPRRPQWDGFGNLVNSIEPGAWDKVVADEDFRTLGGDSTVAKLFPHVWDEINKPTVLQIKGKQNAKPKDDYIPAVREFLKSRKWAEINDARNANLSRLPDGGYVTQEDRNAAVIRRAREEGFYRKGMEERMQEGGGRDVDPESWDKLAPYFEGLPRYKRGGFVVKRKGCQCGGGCEQFAVRRAA